MPLEIFAPDATSTPLAREASGALRLQAEVTYTVVGEPGELDALFDGLPPKVGQRRAARVLQLAFINAVGRFELPHLGAVDVRTGKFGEDDFAAMLTQLADEFAALPLDAGSLAHDAFERGETAALPRYLAFLYLRHITSDDAPDRQRLLPALQVILRHPHRRLVREPRWVPLERTHHVDPGRLAQLLTPRAGLARSTSKLPLATTLQGHLPSHAEESAPRTDLDVPENRFIRHFLDHAQALVRTFRALAPTRSTSFRRRLEADCDHIARALDPVDRHPLWRELSPLRRLPLESTVLQRARGYKDILGHYLRLRQGPRIPLDPATAAELLELKNIATLYELWTFFAVYKTLRGILGDPTRVGTPKSDDNGIDIPKGFAATWPQGHELAYNLCFSRSSKNFSSSVRLYPDITLKVPHGPHAGLHLFDAKFRLHTVSDPLADDDNDDSVSTVRHEDLHKMHTYRDALGARSVWVLYPGTVFKFFPTQRNAPIAHKPDQLPSPLHGVGCLPLQPAQVDTSKLTELLARALSG